MTKCKQCNVTISDDTGICPLCHCVVEADGAFDAAYPAVWIKERKLKRISNISFFAVLLISSILAVINYVMEHEHWWCVIPITAMAYAYLVFRLVIISQKGYRHKVLIPLLFAVILVMVIDVETGFYRWSLNYVLPSGILLVDVIIIILMLTNLRNWHSYIIMQIGMVVAALVPLALWLAGIITNPVTSFVAFGVSLFLFLGMVIVGDRAAKTELKRRFHIR